MLGVSGMLGNSGDGAAAHQSGGGGGGGGEVGVSGPSLGGFSEDEKMRIEDGDRSSGGNRWPRQETIALLKIRSDMDVVFRDSSLKGPLWEEVSRKLADLGYHRSAKKCKEKFENVYKYHKRTKDGRGSKADGKSYRFFDQLEALEQIHQSPVSYAPPLPLPQQPPQQPPQPVVSANPVAVAMPVSSSQVLAPHGTVSSTTNQTISFSQNPIAPIAVNPFPPANIQPPPPATTAAATITTTTTTNLPAYPYTSLGSMSTSSSSTSSDQEAEPSRKRKWEEFFQKVMKNVVEKQEEMQKKFLEKLERRERERVAREEAWRVQEMARLNKEHELMVKERSIAAAKDAAVIAFLEKVSDQHQQVPNINQILLQPPQPPPQPQPRPQAKPSQVHPTPPNSTPIQPQQLPAQPQPQPQQHTTTKPQQLPAPPQQLPAQPQQQAPPQPQPAQLPTQPQHLPTVQSQAIIPIPVANNQKNGTGGENYIGASPSRWPKAEVQALIQLRTNMDIKYQENGPKGPLWEEISGEMKKIGYNRNAKRCKEKWENINKYFKKVKESNKKRPEDSKTCPYFHQLEALYKEKGKNEGPFSNPGFGPKPENPMVPMMVQPEQQWPLRPPPREQHNHQPDSAMEERDSNENDDDEDDEDDEDEANAYEVVTNKPSTVRNATE